ncbi:uncharacterized protein [Dermacentor albipictus]|uniref:uncharacterized protein n=1 Tax=Dermacentor albipictus TaxID=60249 RepID=UPI0038FC0711
MERRRKLAALQLLLIMKRKQALSRKHWVRPVWTKRADESEFFTAMKVMKNGDDSLFFKFYRMSPETFDALHDMVRDRLTKEWVCREPISSGERLALTLRYLSSGMLVRDVAMAFRVGLETARKAIHLTCNVLWEVLSPVYMKPPTEGEWRDIASGFGSRWQFPNCLGAVDGKHVRIRCPRKAGSLYFNYKGTHSIVLMAVADSQYLFRLIDVGAPGRFSDGGIFKDSPIGKRLHEGKLNLPRAAKLPGSERVCPHVFVGDEAFQLRPDFMRPLPGTRTKAEEIIFNYRLSRARRCIENAFGILVSRWRIYERQMNLQPENVESVVKATCILHNFLSMTSRASATYCPPGYADCQDMFGCVRDGTWRQGVASAAVFGLQGATARNCTNAANSVRKQFIEYFKDEGQVSWQWDLPGVTSL